jgi:hypothetical protein
LVLVTGASSSGPVFADLDGDSADGLLMVVLLDAPGAYCGSPEVVEASALVIERGLLGT